MPVEENIIPRKGVPYLDLTTKTIGSRPVSPIPRRRKELLLISASNKPMFDNLAIVSF